MTPFLLAAARPQPGSAAETGLAATAHQVVATTVWQGWLRRWGLLAAYGLSQEPTAELRVFLMVRASSAGAAKRLAWDWETVSGYRVTVLSFTSEPSEGPSNSVRPGGGGFPRGVAASHRSGPADHRRPAGG
jgi:hypothetical protein